MSGGRWIRLAPIRDRVGEKLTTGSHPRISTKRNIRKSCVQHPSQVSLKRDLRTSTPALLRGLGGWPSLGLSPLVSRYLILGRRREIDHTSSHTRPPKWISGGIDPMIWSHYCVARPHPMENNAQSAERAPLGDCDRIATPKRGLAAGKRSLGVRKDVLTVPLTSQVKRHGLGSVGCLQVSNLKLEQRQRRESPFPGSQNAALPARASLTDDPLPCS